MSKKINKEKKEKNKEVNKGKGVNGNLIPIQKGEVRNPTGRPKGQRDYATIYKEALIKLGTISGKTSDELEAEIVLSGLLKARKGNYAFYKDVLDRIHGKALERRELTGAEGGRIELDIDINKAIDKIYGQNEQQGADDTSRPSSGNT